jgi:hypothetical protein
MDKLNTVHLAIGAKGLVLAHFADAGDAAAYCRLRDVTHLPFNARAHHVPPVGTVYRA